MECFIAIICRAICASTMSHITVFPYPDPLQTRSTSPDSAIIEGVSVHLFSNTPFSCKLLAPVIYGVPNPLSLYRSGGKSVPDRSVINSPNRNNFQLSGISNVFSSSVISGSGLSFFIFPSLINFCFSDCICRYNSSAVPSSGRCSTSFPWMASWRMLFFSSCGVTAGHLPASP